MKKGLLIAFLGLLALALSVPAAHAADTGTVAGKAVRWNGDAIAGATIRALAGPLETDKEIARTTTAADGSYALTVPAGQAYWIHIDTFGTWWGYSYQTPFTLQAGETISQVFFALGPRDVKEITLPAPQSNVGPQTGQNPPPVTVPTATPAPISQVQPEVGGNTPPSQPGKPVTVPVHAVPSAPHTLPPTGAPSAPWLPLALVLAALTLVPAGLALRRA